MTSRLAIILALLIAGFFSLDAYVFEWGAGVFLLKKLMDLITYIAFWR